MTGKELIYLYCITNTMPQIKEDMKGVYPDYLNGLYAVVSKVSEDDFNEENLKENLSDMEWLTAKVTWHEKIVEDVMAGNCVVPFKFATLFNTEESMMASIGEIAEDIKEDLKYLESKEEWGVKIYCDTKRLHDFISREEKDILMMDKEISSSLPGKAFFLRKKREGLINEAAFKYSQDFLNRLGEQSIHTRVNRLLPKEITERDDEMILNAAFSVNKKGVDAFINMVDTLRDEYGRSGFSVDCTGPWPPYNFCNLSGRRVEGGKEDQAV